MRPAAATPVLGAKLLPPSPGPFHLRRARLHEALQAGLDRRATALVAGPGYGKSALVARFLQESGGDTVWYSLDSSDRDAAVFFRYLLQGLREHAPEFGERIEWLWKDARPRSRRPEELADVFMGEAEESLGGRFLVVLDRVDALEGSAAARGLKRLLAWLPGTLHLVLVGRSLPDVGLKGLEAEGLAASLGGDRLLFTADETRALLLETFGLPLDAATVRRAHERTRGWVTALRLLRETAGPGGATPDLPERIFAKTESEIFDYFTEKVLDAETPETRTLLIESSPPEVFDPDLLAEVLEGVDARALLPSLLRRNLFLSPLESRAAHVAYDPLFRDYLRRRLAADRSIEERRALESRYARAFARRGEFDPALRHALAAGDTKGIADLLARQGKALLRGGFVEAVQEGCRFLVRRGALSPRVDDLLGESSRLAGDFAAAIGHFERALSPSSKEGEALDGTARASTLQGLAFSLLETGALPRAGATAEEALGAAGADDPALVARILNTLALVHYRSGKHEEAVQRWQEALARARQAGDEHLTSMIAHNLGLPHAVRGDFRRAAECFRILTAPSTRVGPEEGAAYLNLARIALLRGEHADAAALLADAREIAQKLRLRALLADVLEAEGTLLRETGDLKGAAERYARARDEFTGLGRLDLLPGLAEEDGIRLALAGRPEDAERTIAPVVEEARAESGDPERLASALLAAGEIAARAQETARAVARLGEAAAIFDRLERAYPACLAHGWLALAALRGGDRTRAGEAADAALGLSARHDYAAALRRIASADAEFARWIQARAGVVPALHGKAAPEREPAAPRTDAADLTVRLFGPVEVYRDREHAIPPRAWKIRRALTIFCYLAASRDRRAGKERIIEALWGDARLSVIEKNFHPTISFLRRALNDGHAVPRHFILFERGAYRLNPAYRYDIDTERFESDLRQARDRARAGDAAGALAAYDAALPLYRGPFLEEEYDEWAEGPRSHYERLYADALKEAGRLHVARGEGEAGVAWLRRAIELDPLDEAASAGLMLALGSLARRAEVEKEFERLRKALDSEVSGVPSAATRQAFERARRP